MKVCILCEQNVESKIAVPVKEDIIIRTFRSIKSFFGVAKMNELYVCETDFQKHKHCRQSFDRSVLFSSILAGFLFMAFLFLALTSDRLNPLSQNFDLFGIVSAILICFFVLSFPLFRYVPDVDSSAIPASVLIPPQSLPTMQQHEQDKQG